MTSHFAQHIPLRRAVLWTTAFLVFWPAVLQGAEVTHDPRPISDAEYAAVEAVLAFLETGPNAVLTRLSADSPLRSLNSNHALDEIAVRMGPAAGSAWTLRTPGRTFEERFDIAIFSVEFASGVDDVIYMHMQEDAEGWAIYQIRCGVDPRISRVSAEEELLRIFGSDDNESSVTPGDFTSPSPESPTSPSFRWLVLLAALCLLVFGSPALGIRAPRSQTARPGRIRVSSAAVLLAAAVVVAGCQLLPSEEQEVAEEELDVEPDAQELSTLLPLRRALTGGRSSGAAEQAQLQDEINDLVVELVGPIDPNDPQNLAARAWQAQLMVLDGSIAAATKILDTAPTPDTLPLLAILRARVAVALSDKEVIRHYEQARRLGPDHDGLALEAMTGASSIGEEGKFEENARSMVWMQSRDSSGFYNSALFDTGLDQIEKAEELFRAGWQREPLSRAAMLQNPILAHLAIRPDIFPLLRFGDAAEPAMGPRRAAKRPLTIPERASARILGEHLVIQMGDRSLSILGGGDLRPEGTVVESAFERTEREVDDAIARFDELAASLAEGGLLRPSHRRALEALTISLSFRGEWEELVRLTDPLDANLDGAPPDLILTRALALMRTGQKAAATNLVIGLARSDEANRRRDPSTYFQLGQMLTELGQYDLALRALERASSLSRFDFTAQRRLQIELMKELDESKKVYESRHFRMIYPATTGERYPRQLSWVLEAEWDRVQKWIPVPQGSPKVEIHLFPFNKFTKAYARAGGEVGGLYYDGAVRVPLADFESFHPQLIRVVSHEVAHAMIDIATRGNNPPKWFHEGLAGHIEMHQRELNPMPDMHAAQRDLSFTLLEPMLAGWSEPQLVELAYTNAAWTLHYIEAKEGPSGIHKMLEAFRRGHDTEGAIRKVFGISVEQFDRDFRDWAIRDAPPIWPSEMVAYHEKFDDLVRRDSMDPLENPEADSRVLRSRSGKPTRQGILEADMRRWHKSYTTSVRPVKVALGKAMPLLQGKTQGDVQGACRDLEKELSRLLRDRRHLDAPDAQAALYLRNAYSSFDDMTKNCRQKKWKSMRADMERAVKYLGQAKDQMAPYGIKP